MWARKPNKLDTTRAAELFGFRAHTDFVEGLRQTINWYRAERQIPGRGGVVAAS